MPAGMEEFDQMYSVRIAPWHKGTGTNVIMLDTAPETRMARMEAAGQAWTVEAESVFQKRVEIVDSFSGPQASEVYEPMEDWKLLRRSDTRTVLHVAKDSYQVIQNVVGHELFEALSQGATLTDGTGGTIQNGAVCYLTARLDEPVFVFGDPSPIYPYVVVTWAHDGSGALTARRTSIRIVCQNTHGASELEGRRTGLEYTFRHTSNVMERISDAKRVISGARESTAAFIELAEELARTPVSDRGRELFITEFIPKPEADVVSQRVLNNIERDRDRVRGIFASPTIPEMHRNTAYGLVEAGVEYLDHLRGYRNSDTYLSRTLLRSEPLKGKLVKLARECAAA